MIRNSSVSFAAALVLGAASSTLAHAEDLLQIYQMARASDPQLATVAATSRASGENVDQAFAALLPQISANLNYQKSHGSNVQQQLFPTTDGTFELFPSSSSGHNYGTTLQGTLTQNILDISKFTSLKASKAQAESSEADYDAAQQNLLIRVATAYLSILANEDNVRFAEANEKALARQLEQAEQRFEVGLSAITDVNEARAQHDSATANRIIARNTLDDSREALRELTGKPAGELKHLRENLPMNSPEPNEAQAWVDLALKKNPSLMSKQSLVDAAQYNINTARAGHLPTLSASLIYRNAPTWSDTNISLYGGFHFNSESTDTALGLSLKVPLFTGGYTQSQIRQAVDNRDVAQNQFEQQRRAVIRQTNNTFRAIVAGISAVQARKQAVVSAQSALDATQAGFEVGTRTIVDVLLSQQQLFQAQSDYSVARHTFIINELQLKQSVGVIELKDLEMVNALLE